MMKTEKKLLTTQELAAVLGVSDARVRKLRLDGRLPGAVDIGGTWVYPAGLASQGFAKRKAGRPSK